MAARWRSVLVVGVFKPPGEEHGRTSFGIVGGRNPAVPLDPGDYARVQISIDESQWNSLEPGRYELHVVLAMLAVRPAEPLTVELTRECIEEHRSRTRSQVRTPAETRESLEQQHSRLQALIEASGKLDAVARVVTAAATGDIAQTEVQHMLQCDADAASAVINSPLRQFSDAVVQQLREQAQQIQDKLTSLRTT